MSIDHDAWHDGVGYDLAALRAATAEERRAIEELLVRRGLAGWREVEALAALATPTALAELRHALGSARLEIKIAIVRYAPELAAADAAQAILLDALRRANPGEGLEQALAVAATFRGSAAAARAPLVAEIRRGVLARRGDIAARLADLLAFLNGKIPALGDPALRPHLGALQRADPGARTAAFREFCAHLQLDPETGTA